MSFLFASLDELTETREMNIRDELVFQCLPHTITPLFSSFYKFCCYLNKTIKYKKP